MNLAPIARLQYLNLSCESCGNVACSQCHAQTRNVARGYGVLFLERFGSKNKYSYRISFSERFDNCLTRAKGCIHKPSKGSQYLLASFPIHHSTFFTCCHGIITKYFDTSHEVFGRALRKLLHAGRVRLESDSRLALPDYRPVSPVEIDQDQLQWPSLTGSRSDRRYDDWNEVPRRESARDRDRILFSTFFKRLAGTTQVVSPDELPLFHNRLTHSLEVAHIGKRFAERLKIEYPEHSKALLGQIDPEVVEAAGLAHDLGHPPFGHIAEDQLDRCFQEKVHGDKSFEGFEGNAQTFRIVTRLAARVREDDSEFDSDVDLNTVEPGAHLFLGLNLTRATLNAIMKYPWLRIPPHAGVTPDLSYRKKKFGAYSSELQVYTWARQGLRDGEITIEAQIMNWADDIAYSLFDIYDFFRVGMIPLETISRDEQVFGDVMSAYIRELASARNYDYSAHFVAKRSEDIFRGLLGLFPANHRFEGTRIESGELHQFINVLISRYLRRGVVNLKQNSQGQLFLDVDPVAEFEIEFLKFLTRHYVIDNPALAHVQKGQGQIISELFDFFWDAAQTGRFASIPPSTREWLSKFAGLDRTGSTSDAEIGRTVCDTIASMTEHQVYVMHGKLVGHSGVSALQGSF